MLIDEFMPRFDFRERHATIVRAPATAVRRAAEEWQPRNALLWRALFRMRGLGKMRRTLREWAEANGFLRLAETDQEIVYGQAGRFWAVNERAALVSPRTPDAFRRFATPGSAAAVIDICLLPLDAGRTRLSTETRVRAVDSTARRRFRLYWLAIRPFSGLLRRSMLSGIRRRAEVMASRRPSSAGA